MQDESMTLLLQALSKLIDELALVKQRLDKVELTTTDLTLLSTRVEKLEENSEPTCSK